MKTNPNQPAYPLASIEFQHLDADQVPQVHGLTKREYFAAMAMQGLIMMNGEGHLHFEGSEVAVKIADALINELNK